MSQEYQAKIMALIQGARTAAAEPNHTAAAKFLAENGKKTGVITTASGLQYKVISPGTGENPKPTDQVSVNYTGKLLNNTEFDASAKHGGPAKFAREPGHSGLAGSADPDEAGCEIPAVDSAQAGV